GSRRAACSAARPGGAQTQTRLSYRPPLPAYRRARPPPPDRRTRSPILRRATERHDIRFPTCRPRRLHPAATRAPVRDPDPVSRSTRNESARPRSRGRDTIRTRPRRLPSPATRLGKDPRCPVAAGPPARVRRTGPAPRCPSAAEANCPQGTYHLPLPPAPEPSPMVPLAASRSREGTHRGDEILRPLPQPV